MHMTGTPFRRPNTTIPSCPATVDTGKLGISSYGNDSRSFRWSTRLPAGGDERGVGVVGQVSRICIGKESFLTEAMNDILWSLRWPKK